MIIGFKRGLVQSMTAGSENQNPTRLRKENERAGFAGPGGQLFHHVLLRTPGRRTWKTRDVSGISLPTYVIITIGLALWLVYGWLRGDMPLMVANAVMVVLTGAITVMKLMFGKSVTQSFDRLER